MFAQKLLNFLGSDFSFREGGSRFSNGGSRLPVGVAVSVESWVRINVQHRRGVAKRMDQFPIEVCKVGHFQVAFTALANTA